MPKTIYSRFTYLGIITSFFFVLLAIAQSFHYSFFAWNTFLAFLPLAFILGALELQRRNKNSLLVYFLIFLWFAFFPNSAYLITDMIHIRPSNNWNVPYWFDVMYFMNVAIIGIFTAFESLKLFLDNYVAEKWKLAASVFIWFISCVGIYIGREWRFNSWDILALPFQLHQQEIELRDVVPFLTVWPLSLALWFWLWSGKNEATKNPEINSGQK